MAIKQEKIMNNFQLKMNRQDDDYKTLRMKREMIRSDFLISEFK